MVSNLDERGLHPDWDGISIVNVGAALMDAVNGPRPAPPAKVDAIANLTNPDIGSVIGAS